MIVERRNEDQLCLRQHTHNGDTLKKLASFRKDGVLCDITIVVDGKTFPAHKNVLASGSPYFYAMFTSSMMESKIQEVSLESLSADVFDQILKYFYEGTLTIDMNSIADILHAANFLLLKDIKNECFHYLKKNVNLKNCVHIKSIGEVYSNDELLKKTNEFLRSNFQRLAQEIEITNFLLKDLKSLLKSEDLMCKSEDIIALVVNKWLLVRPVDVTPTDMSNLLKTVRIPSLSEDGMNYLENAAKELDKKNGGESYSNTLSTEIRIQNRSQKRRAVKCRKAHLKEQVLFCAGRYGDCFGYSMSSNKLRRLEVYPELKQPSEILVDGNTVYAIGSTGLYAPTCSFVLYSYDINEDKWTKLPSMSRARYLQSTVILSGKLYVIGGKNMDSSNTNLTHSVECYDPSLKTWVSKASTAVARINSCAVATSKHAYVIGGADSWNAELQATNAVEKYCPHKDRWDRAPSLITHRCKSSVVYFDERIFVFGGRNMVELHTFEYLELNAKQWVQVAFPHATPICTALTIDDKMLVLGHSFWGDDQVLQYYAQRRRGHWQKVNNFIHTSHRNKNFKYAPVELLNYDFENKPATNCGCNEGVSSDDDDEYISDSSDILDSDDDMLMDLAPWGMWV